MQSLHQTYLIHAPIEKVWDALTNSQTITAWGAGPAKMSDKLEKFSLWGGDIWGTNTKVIPEKQLVQDWYSGGWKKASVVQFDLSEKDNVTTVVLMQKNIPDEEIQDIALGWEGYYMGPLKKLLEKK